MFDPSADPIAHVPVYKRIAMNEAKPADANVHAPTTWEICDALMKRHEAERLWKLVVQTAEGTNAPVPVLDVQD